MNALRLNGGSGTVESAKIEEVSDDVVQAEKWLFPLNALLIVCTSVSIVVAEKWLSSWFISRRGCLGGESPLTLIGYAEDGVLGSVGNLFSRLSSLLAAKSSAGPSMGVLDVDVTSFKALNG